MSTPQKQYRGESRMDYLTRTEADEMDRAPMEWGPLTWAFLGGVAAAMAAWIGFLIWLSWRVLS